MGSLLRILHLPLALRSMFQIQQEQLQAAGGDVAAAPLCCARGLFPRGSHGPLNDDDGLQRTVDVVTTADQANAGAVTESSATRWKRIASPSNTSVSVEGSSTLSNGVSSADGTTLIPLCPSVTPSANITSPISSSTHDATSAPNSAQLVSTLTISTPSPSLFSTCIPQTPFPLTTPTETLMTSATFPSSTSPIVTSRGLTSLRSSTSTSATSFPTHHSTGRSRPSPSFTMSNSDTITLAPVNPTSTAVIGTGASQSGSGSDTTLISSISSTPFINPTFVSSSTVFSPIPSTSALLTSIAIPSPYPSISAISLSSISDDDPTITPTSTASVNQTVTVSETGALSTDTPHDTSFANQTGAIVGVTIGGAFFLLLIILFIFFACKRLRSNRSYNSSMEDILATSRRDTPWRPPLETDDDEHYLAAYGRSTSFPKTFGSRSERGRLSNGPLSNGSGRSADANGVLAAYGRSTSSPKTFVSQGERGLSNGLLSNGSGRSAESADANGVLVSYGRSTSSPKYPKTFGSQGGRGPLSNGSGRSAESEGALASYGRSTSSPKYPKTYGSQGERGPFDDPLSNSGGRSGSADANGALLDFGSQPPVAQTLHGSTHSSGPISLSSYSSNDSHGSSRPWWWEKSTEPLNVHKRNSSQNLPPTVDSHVSAIGRRSISSLGLGGSSSSNGHLGPGSSGETLLPGNRHTSIPEQPKPVHKLSGRRHYSTPPTAFVGRNSSLEYGTERTPPPPPQQQQQQQQQVEEQNQRYRGNRSLSQIILARILASRRSSNASTEKAYSQCTTLESEESAPSRTSSHMYSPSLLNPPIAMSQSVVAPRTSYTFPRQHLLPTPRQDTSRGLVRWPMADVTLPPPFPAAPSPVPTDTSSMVEGLLHPRLGMALGSSQRASAMSLRDHEDYTRPINGLVNNHIIRSTTTFETQNTVDLSEGGTV